KQMRALHEGLVPGVRYRQDDEGLQVQYPGLAQAALQTAAWLCELEKAQPWTADLIQAARESTDQAKLNGLLDQLELALQRLPLVQKVFDGMRLLEPYVTARGLQEPQGLACRGQSIQPWLDAVLKGLDGLDALVALDAARPQRQGFDKE